MRSRYACAATTVWDGFAAANRNTLSFCSSMGGSGRHPGVMCVHALACTRSAKWSMAQTHKQCLLWKMSLGVLVLCVALHCAHAFSVTKRTGTVTVVVLMGDLQLPAF